MATESHRIWFRWVLPVLSAAFCLFVFELRDIKIRTSMEEVLGNIDSQSEDVKAASNTVVIMPGDGEGDVVRERTASLADRFGSLDNHTSVDIRGVSDEDAVLLENPEGRKKIAERAVRRFFSSPVPPLFPIEEDPFCLNERYVMSLGAKCADFSFLNLKPEVAADLDRLAQFADEAKSAFADLPGVEICGVPMHIAASAGRCKKEIGFLTLFSFVFIVALSAVVFKSVKWLPLLTMSLVFSTASGAAVVFLFHDSVHLIALVFGTSVLGLVIDYSFHWLLRNAGEDAAVRRNLCYSLLTTEISLVPLMFSSIGVLNQSALFLAVALIAAFLFVLVAYPVDAAAGKTSASSKPGWRGFPVSIGAFIVIILAFGLTFFTEIKTDVKALYKPTAELASAEKRFAETMGLIVSPEKQAASDANIRLLYAEQGERIRDALGLKENLKPPTENHSGSEMLQDILDGLTQETCSRLGWALVAMLVFLAVSMPKRAVRVFLPSVAAIEVSVAAVLLCGSTVNLFHLLACFLLAGMTVDYTLFLHSDDSGHIRSVVCSLLTSMAGFGALAFVSFPVVNSFGIVLGIGLPAGFGFALLTRPPVKNFAAPATEKCASPLGMEIVYLVYRVFGLRTMHFLASAIGLFVSIAHWRDRAYVRKVMCFARSLSDKMILMAEGRNLPALEWEQTEDALSFHNEVIGRRGVFILSSHCGTVEMLAAAGADAPKFHAWMDFDRTSVYTSFYLRHKKRGMVELHPVSEIGMETAFEAGQWLDDGECVVMAGDRGDGAFRFARALRHSVYFAACLEVRDGYKVVVKRLPEKLDEMKSAYYRELERLKSEYPEQWFGWNEG